MIRTRAEALVLVNWKGVFYERYLLDRHVTALEGANGAGKTTVMIAAYVVLLPDMSRLRFTNLGETGATGGDKGIWGRLGEPGRPSYAAIDFALPRGERLVAGVHLERKGEPSVEPTPFVVMGLPPDVRLQDLMLVRQGEDEAVPEMAELRENAGRLGGRLQVFSAARDYFLSLFDHGVTPLRLGTEEEKSKLNEMLRTSMTGGISRALTSELRNFLLKEESGLATTLAQMKANLDACRRTRTEVQEARRLEQEIGGVLQAGHEMFAAVFSATRERAAELQRRVADVEAQRATAAQALAREKAALDRVEEELATTSERRGRVEMTSSEARHREERVRQALAAAAEVVQHQAELKAAEADTRAKASLRTAAEEMRERKRAELRRAEEHHRRAAEGLADMQQGIEVLHRRAGAYLQVSRRLRAAESHLRVVELPIGELDDRRDACRAELTRVDQDRRDASVRLADADEHRARHEEVLSALARLVAGEVEAESAHAIALEALRTHRERRALAERFQAIDRELTEARRLAGMQAQARARAEALGLSIGEAPAAGSVNEALEVAEAQRGRAREAEAAISRELQDLEHERARLRSRHAELTELRPRWQTLEAHAGRLAERLDLSIVDREGLDRARRIVGERIAEATGRERELKEAYEERVTEARRLLASGGPFPQPLLRLKDDLDAELLAVQFEEVSLGEAARLEARLGPLAQALVVDDPVAAARAASIRADDLPSVWLVGRDADLGDIMREPDRTATNEPDVVVEEGIARRVTRIPAHSRLGRRARERRATELRAEAEALSRELENARAGLRTLSRCAEDGDAVLAGTDTWLAGDPSPEIVEVERSIAQLGTQAERLRHTAAREAAAAQATGPRIEGLRALLADAHLLDPPDHGERTRTLGAERDAAAAARAEVARTQKHADLVEDQIAVLRQPPLSETQLSELRDRVATLRAERDRLEGAIEAIEHVIDNVEALGWSDAPARLAGEQALVPALKAQLTEAEEARDLAEKDAAAASGHAESATATWQDAEGRRRAVSQQLDAAKARLHAFEIDDPTEELLADARAEVARLQAEIDTLAKSLETLFTERGRRETKSTEAADRLERAEIELGAARREAEPAVERWERLREQAMQHDLLGGAMASEEIGPSGIRGHVNLVQEAARQRAILLERLRGAQGGGTLLAQLQVLRDASDAAFADEYLDLWLAVRDWLRRRLPAQVAEVDDPREALARLRDRLASLEQRLAQQEDDLRGASEDVARGIDVQIRKARGQVTRLNRNLEGVSFGSIEGIRVRLQPVDRMEQVLRALREGAAQGLLFQEDLPIEQALDEIFRRYGGGRTGGQRLLDYREYVHLQVQIRRKTGDADWEVANPTRLSTGEAIGVGAALMMVVLTEWERDATLLRGKKTHGSLRFLFLDEANRLSHDNLGVLFDLCQTLDLQLLIAAPEVARAEGNTTYRLVRRADANGREEVVVSGRRTREPG